MSDEAGREPEALTAGDLIGASLAGMAALALAAFTFVGRSFAAMHRDLGGAASLPLLSKLATSLPFPLAVAGAAIALLAVGVAVPLPLARRRALFVAAFVVATVGLAACVVGVYLPVFRLGESIRGD